MNYSYSISSVDNASKTMIVEYKSEGLESHQFNMHIPAEGVSVDEYIQKYAPIQRWIVMSSPLATVVEGHEGVATYAAPVATPEPQMVTDGVVREEYLRALIFQVLEEIKAAQV
jgi:hypothetical protein